MKVRTWRTQVKEHDAPNVHRVSIGKSTINTADKNLVSGVYITFSDSKGGSNGGTIAEILMSYAEYEDFMKNMMEIKTNHVAANPGIKYTVDTYP